MAFYLKALQTFDDLNLEVRNLINAILLFNIQMLNISCLKRLEQF